MLLIIFFILSLFYIFNKVSIYIYILHSELVVFQVNSLKKNLWKEFFQINNIQVKRIVSDIKTMRRFKKGSL